MFSDKNRGQKLARCAEAAEEGQPIPELRHVGQGRQGEDVPGTHPRPGTQRTRRFLPGGIGIKFKQITVQSMFIAF